MLFCLMDPPDFIARSRDLCACFNVRNDFDVFGFFVVNPHVQLLSNVKCQLPRNARATVMCERSTISAICRVDRLGLSAFIALI